MHAGIGHNHCIIPLKPLFKTLGPEKAAARPGLHAFTGADQTGQIAGMGKVSGCLALEKSDQSVLVAFAALGKNSSPSDRMVIDLEKFVIQLYDPGTKLTDVGALRWQLFTKNQAEAKKLPPTKSGLQQHILHANYQPMVWWNDYIHRPSLPSATEYGWRLEDGFHVPVLMMLPSAPEAVIELVKCNCKKSHYAQSSRCSCRSNNLNCTEMAACGADEDACQNLWIINMFQHGDLEQSGDDHDDNVDYM